ncbi:esterase [Leadbetterella byssophila DSM 17132]|uniref:Esterase n=1 Tax=Leadbetterella byssophila (strain DSM 17132 / JCM 16389 / KACC 11308 / NBRC 106382 / 4M15) TaxID=649349 RepID=E4RRQ7_LEAB4|nr:alpha/beta hydrolase-fold protein [Leadbetterella byssophila]ADQ16713.1 esterase [Leadbetterella byssophila DSM 17132]
MKWKFIILLALFCNQIFAQQIARVENVKIKSEILNQEREILVYTPVDYDWRTNEYFKVIYVLDCQNREFFDYTSSIISFLTNGSSAFIIVGISSPYNEALDYSRNNDFLPVLQTESSKRIFGKYSGNADNFMGYIEKEVMPYIRENYRILDQKIIIGHSLGASFILYSFLEKPNLFRNYIAISPNLAYDENYLSERLSKFDYSKIKYPTFIYLSNADEGINYWKEWKFAREHVYSFFRDSLRQENFLIKIDEFTNNSHWNTFPPALNNALEFYFKNIQEKEEDEISEQEYETTIRLKVPNKEDTVYISGNQTSLGNWNANAVKMNRISDYEREIILKLKSPAKFKFTRGSWESEAEVQGTYSNIIIKPELKNAFTFKIENYADRYDE